MTNVGIAGYGYWGKNLVRNFNQLKKANLTRVCDPDPEKLKALSSLYPAIETTTEFDDLLNDTSLGAIVIATPVNIHYPLAKKALEAGKHVLVEKPLTDNFEQAKELVELSNEQKKVLMVDHTFLYTGAVRHIKELIDSGSVGKLEYLDSTRINLGLFQHDVNVLWDLAAHDLSICEYFFGKKPIAVQAVGVSHVRNEIENIAYLTLRYENNTIAHFNCSWVSPVKIRQMLIGGDKKMIVYNDMEPTEKVKIYDTGYEARTDEERTKILIDYRVGDIHVPKVSRTEALALMAEDFINAVQNGTSPVSDALLGLNVVEVLDAAQTSIKEKGKEIMLS